MIRSSMALALALFAAPALAGPDERWEALGEKAVDFKAERDVIEVGAREGRFDAIRFSVHGNAVEVLDVTLRFGNGESQDIQVRERIAEGGTTRVIDLQRDDRVINRVELVYRTNDNRRREGRATVRLHGRHSQRAAGEDWVRLGQREVAFRTERDTIMVTGVEGRFTKVVVEVNGNGIEVRDLELHFGDGSKQDVQVRQQIPQGGRTRVIDIEGAARVINRVVIVYKTEDRADGRATIVLHGLRAPGADAGAGNQAGGGGGDPEREGWTRLGEREVAFRAERDTIQVGREAGRFTKLRFQVRGNAIEVLSIRVTFGNDQVQELEVRERLAEGGSTRAIELGGNEARFIKQVELVYRTDGPNREGRATVRLFGKQ
jgi:hypothetical protein